MDFIDNLSSRTKLVIAFGVAIALGSFPFSLAIILTNAGNVSYKNQDTEISFSGKTKKAVNDTEYSTKELANKLIKVQSDIADLKFSAQQNPELIPQKIQDVDESFQELIPTANQAFEDTEELTEYVESAISQP